MPQKKTSTNEKTKNNEYDPAKTFLEQTQRGSGTTTEAGQAFLDLLAQAKQKAREKTED
jgi:hypothetical protein